MTSLSHVITELFILGATSQSETGRGVDCKGAEAMDVGEGLRGGVSPRQPQVGPEVSKPSLSSYRVISTEKA